METLELPILEELEDTLAWSAPPPVHFAEQAIDLAAFQLWREASPLDTATDQNAAETDEGQ
jgi:hypothetical protein